ncbi:exostosin family protein [Isosphaeraceae bacterium EP7]
MARIYLTSVAEKSGSEGDANLVPLRVLQAAAATDRRREHETVDAPDRADLILFCESHRDDSASGPYFEQIRSDPVFRKYRDKSVIISGMDRIVPLMPGIYASMERGWHRRSVARSGPYLVDSNPFLRYCPLDQMPTDVGWLASFIGSAKNKAVRLRMLQLRDDRILLEDTSGPFVDAIRAGDEARLNEMKRYYVEMTLASKFSLCPRGTGSSSFRVFESLEMGRAPIIVSDAWVEPDGIDWGRCSLRIREDQIDRIPAILREREADAVAMGKAARQAWEDNFGPDQMFHWIASQALLLQETGPISRRVDSSLAWLQFARPYHLKRLLKQTKSKGARLLGLRK